MTELQKAYLIGRESAFNGGTGTHLYAEMIYHGNIEDLNIALNRVIATQPMLRACVFDSENFGIESTLNYKISLLNGHCDDEKVIMQQRNLLSHKKYTRDDFPFFTMEALGGNEVYRIFFSIDLLIADGLSLYELMKQIKMFLLNPNESTKDYGEELLYMSDYYQQIRNSKRYNVSREYYVSHIDDIYPAPQINYSNISNPNQIRFSRKEFVMDKSLYDRLKRKIDSKTYSLTDFLLTTYALILSKWSRDSEMSINVTSFNRPKGDEYYKVIGDFTSSFLLKSNINLQKNLNENIDELKLNLITSLRYKHFEVSEILRELDKRSKEAKMPVVFTSMLFTDNDDLFDNVFELKYWISQTPQVYLDYQAKNIDGTLNISWDYRTDVFDCITIDKMFADYCGLITEYIEIEIDIIESFKTKTNNDLVKLYQNYNTQTPAFKYQFKSLLDHWLGTVNKYPNKVFSVIGNISYTFSEVHKLALKKTEEINNIKHKSGKGKTRIAFNGNKSIDSLVCIIAAILTNDSFCVINESFGNEKTSEILQSLQDYIYYKDGIVSEISKSTSTIAQDESYILYTSGTTGEPKGIIIDEKAALNTVYTIIKMFNVSDKDNTLNISNLYFDLSIFDVFGAIITGMTIYMVNIYDTTWFFENGFNNTVSIWNSTPALAKEFLLKMEFSNIRLVLVSGDFVSTKLVSDIYEKYNDVTMIAMGGATEASIWSNYFDCKIHNTVNAIPYGLPLANQELYIIGSDNNNLKDAKVMGEICIAGEGLAEGYLSSKQTEEAFVYSEVLDKMIYRTGDLGYLGYDNYIYIIGRVANEIKHNGYRIDLYEIEKYVNEVSGVKNSVVFIDKMKNGRTRLICFIVSDDIKIEKSIRHQLSKELPSYMIPSNYVIGANVPLTTNGKIDRNIIIKNIENKSKNINFTENEKELINLFKSTISLEYYQEPQSPEDTYFDMGGQSLEIIKLKESLDEYYGIEISLQDLMDNFSIHNLTEFIVQSCLSDSGLSRKNIDIQLSQQVILLRKGDNNNKSIVFIHAGSGEVNIYLALSQHINSEYNIYAIKYEQTKPTFSPQQISFKELADKYNNLLTPIKNINFIGGWCIGGTIAYEISLINPLKYKNVFLINSLAPQNVPINKFDIDFNSEQKLVSTVINRSKSSNFSNDSEKLWSAVISQLEKSKLKKNLMLAMLPKTLVRLIPNFENLPTDKIVYYLNLFRSFERERFLYTSTAASPSHFYYFSAISEDIEEHVNWRKYVAQLKEYYIPGDHVTIFSEENSQFFGEKFNECLSEIEEPLSD